MAQANGNPNGGAVVEVEGREDRAKTEASELNRSVIVTTYSVSVPDDDGSEETAPEKEPA